MAALLINKITVAAAREPLLVDDIILEVLLDTRNLGAVVKDCYCLLRPRYPLACSTRYDVTVLQL